MRRIPAIGRLLLIASAYVSPIVMSIVKQTLALHYRRDGKHHRSMMDKISRSGGDGFHDPYRNLCYGAHPAPKAIYRTSKRLPLGRVELMRPEWRFYHPFRSSEKLCSRLNHSKYS